MNGVILDQGNIQHSDFVGIYDGFFSDEFCDNLIKYFEWVDANNRTWVRPEPELTKKDTSLALNPIDSSEVTFAYENTSRFLKEFNDVFWGVCYKNYTETYSALDNYSAHTVRAYKVQKTKPKEGYHTWHCEDNDRALSVRIGTYILYLNDIEEGGETEFLYLSKRISPKKGRLVIFPPNYPWTHRGNPPLKGDKYILTGWTEFN